MDSGVKSSDLRKVTVVVHYTLRQAVKELLDRMDVRWAEDRKGIFHSTIILWVDEEKAWDVEKAVRPLCKEMI